ncbi:MAG: hypothetical protein CL868_20860 [Cytophagaceae bacterium]|nr:hypothetical protein [Cytophagaceae bacterium]
MNNPKAIKLLDKITEELEHNGIITNTIVQDLKDLRPFAVEEQRPLLAKTIRLTFEHIEEYETFAIGIPEDEPIEDEELGEVELETTDAEPKESLLYLLSLIKDSENPTNRLDLRAYVEAMQEYAEEN